LKQLQLDTKISLMNEVVGVRTMTD